MNLNLKIMREAREATKQPAGQASSAPAPAAAASSYAHIRSCTVCRQRKVKCDRQHPCSNCVRAGSECVYPSGPGRAPKRPRQGVDTKVLDRLAQLESTIRHLQAQNRHQNAGPSSSSAQEADSSSAGDDVSPPEMPGNPAAAAAAAGELRTGGGPPEDSVAKDFGRLMVDDTSSYYVGNRLWADLGDEAPDSGDEEDMLAEAAAAKPTASQMSNAALFQFRSLAHSLRSLHPSLQQSVALFNYFRENVVPLVHIFHMPTTTQAYWEAVGSLDTIDKDTEALLLSIYYSTIISLGDAECTAILGLSRAAALERYRFAVEQALARANLLNTRSLILLQAAVVFLAALRNEDGSRTVWSLTALVFHLAQAMAYDRGLHRDGATFGLRPMETELRRRLWCHIYFLDYRSTEYHGYEPIVPNEFVFDTRPPLNINDADITADMTEPPAERVGVTEMTFCLVRIEATRVGWRINYVSPSVGLGRTTGSSLRERQALVEDMRRRLHERYTRHCDPAVPIQHLIMVVATLISTRCWLVVTYPSSRSGTRPSDADAQSSLRDLMFKQSIEVIELATRVMTHKDFAPFLWHMRTYAQWPGLAIVLAELCARGPSEDCDRAWHGVSVMFEDWETAQGDERGELWRPILRLLAKARRVREQQQQQAQTQAQAQAQAQDDVAMTSAPPQPSSLSMSSSSEAVAPPSSSSLFGGTGVGGDDVLLPPDTSSAAAPGGGDLAMLGGFGGDGVGALGPTADPFMAMITGQLMQDELFDFSDLNLFPYGSGPGSGSGSGGAADITDDSGFGGDGNLLSGNFPCF
ncbi:fungal-specific transcription factor domain-containing protein [Xylariaceae sp. FL0804]|nr:fungal-specific transcription factor domain-containing protein [Xylariaceae sp. FL0804]